MNGTTRKALFIAAGCLLLTGCGPTKSAATAAGTSPSSTSTPADTAGMSGGSTGLNACNLVNEQEASTAIGSPAGAGQAGGTSALSECIYADGALIVSMKTDSKALYDKSRSDALAKGATNVPDLGDSGFAAGATGFCTLLFLKGTTLVSVLFGGDDAQNTAIAVAKVAASKL